MKHLNCALALLLSIVLFSCGGSDSTVIETKASPPETRSVQPPVTTPSPGKYQVKSGILEYALGSGGVEMQKMYYFDDYGKRERLEIYYEDRLTEVQLTDGVNRYSYRETDPEKIVWNHGTAGRGIMPQVNIELMKNRKDITVLPATSFLGLNCDSYVYASVKSTITFRGYKGVQMFMESDGQIPTYDKAVNADFDMAVPREKFSLPQGYNVQSI